MKLALPNTQTVISEEELVASQPQIKLPKDVTYILNKLHQAGYKAYVVGGCVRDSLLGKKPKDWDICTSATPEQTEQVFDGEHIIETGLQHGTITIMKHKEPYEITTFRIDGEYSDGRHPDSVEFTDDLTKDLSRRDFTINAMAYNYEEGLIDTFSGQVDLKNKEIYCVGNPYRRFEEDSLRILRALRFAVRYDYKIHPTTTMAIIELCDDLPEKVSAERIQGEFCKILTSDCKSTARILSNFPYVFETFLPELHKVVQTHQNNPWHCYGVWGHTIQAIKHCESDDLITRLAVFFHDFGKSTCHQVGDDGIDHFRGHGAVGAEMTDTILRRLKFDNETREKVVELVKFHDNIIEPTRPAVKRLLNKIGIEQIRRLVNVRIADVKAQNPVMENGRIVKAEHLLKLAEAIVKEQSCFSLKDLSVNGTDLIELGFPPGKELGKILETLLNEVLEENVPNEKEALLNYVTENFELPPKHHLTK